MTPEFRRFIAPAMALPHIWRLVVGAVLCCAVYVAFIALVLASVRMLAGPTAALAWMQKVSSASTPTSTLILFASFFGMVLGPAAAARLLHKRPALTLIGEMSTFRRHFLASAGVVLVIYGLSVVLWQIYFQPIGHNAPDLWLLFLPLALLGIFIQTGAEELFFRGYLQQQLAARFSAPWVWILLPSLAFGAVHYDPGSAGENVWMVVAAAGLFGLVAADLTRITGNLGAAWGFHFANNVLAILIIATQGSVTGLALFVTPYSITDSAVLPAVLLLDLSAMGIAWFILRRLLSR